MRVGSVAVLGLLACFPPISSAQQVLLAVDGPAAADLLGRAVDWMGDLNGDGVPEVIAGAPFSSPNQPQSGYVVVLNGASGQAFYNFPGAQNGSMLGASVAAAGDVDLDGFPDLVAGSPLVLPPLPGGPPNPPGKAFVHSGKTGALLYTFASAAIGDGFGRSVDGGHDVNADGFPDVIVGADYGDFAQVFSGKDGSILHTFNADNAGDFFGFAVAMPGDMDGDGFADLAVGARLDDNTGADSGSVRAFSGNTGSTLYTLNGDSAGDAMGTSVAGAGDINADGLPDLVAGAYKDDDGGTDAGSARVFAGVTGLILNTFHGEAAGDFAGYLNGVDGAGDANGDGRDDVLVSSPLNDQNGTSAGRIRVFSGTNGALLGAANGDGPDFILGAAVRGGADFDGDGGADLVIGAYGDDMVGGANSGHVRVVSLCPDASWNNYGAGWPGTLGVPGLVALQDPVLGSPLSIQVDDSTGAGTLGYLLIGLSAISTPTTLDGTLLVPVVPGLTFPIPIPAPSVVVGGTLPHLATLCGVSVHLQVLEVDPGASKGASFTPGLRLLLGG